MTGEIKVLNRYHLRTVRDYDDWLLIDITRASKLLGNPFVMSDRSDQERDRVVIEHLEWMESYLVTLSSYQEFVNNVRQQLRFGRSVGLVCVCSPKKCHGDNHLAFIEKGHAIFTS